MSDQIVPDEHHISRHCRKTKCSEDGKPRGAAFMLRDDESALSVNWLEFLHKASIIDAVDEVRLRLGQVLNLKTGDQLAVLNVGSMRIYVRQETANNQDLQVKHEPVETDESHAGIFGSVHGEEGDLIADLIAEKVSDLFPAVL